MLRLDPPAPEAATHLVALLHGYGADATDLLDVARAWQAALPQIAVVLPEAPEPLPHPMLGGAQWFALTHRDPREIATGAASAAPALLRRLDPELTRIGLGWDRLILAGFSQGAMMALEAGLRHGPAPCAGILAFSGRLPDPIPSQPVHAGALPPVLLVHGEEDDVVEPWHLEVARDALQTLGCAVETVILADVGHWIDPAGSAAAIRFLSTLTGPSSA
ncbi:alpha/beta hydrolase [Roseibium aestuarii]|uniref:Alpha/beta hydrolase n=1 Tax=Roseibium aestuarii TaxID=2600299 RepID=A0ABW4JVF1_9HYPH|nr:prolyl oligopeptidase family serine peptidase [Roseibium aestuarii]